jgi:hypothetical protein
MIERAEDRINAAFPSTKLQTMWTELEDNIEFRKLVLKELAEIETAIHQLRKQINALEGDEEE